MQFTGPPLGFETFCVIDRHRAGTISAYSRLKSREKSAIFAAESRNVFDLNLRCLFVNSVRQFFFLCSAFWKGSGSENGFSGN